MASIYIYLLSLIILPQILASEYDLTVEVPAGKFQCFYQPVADAKYKTLEVDYQVIDGADLNVNFMILLGAEVLVQEVMKTDGTHKFVKILIKGRKWYFCRVEIKQIGDYQICFDNTFSIQSRKVVFFEVFLMDENGNVEDTDISSFAKNDPNFLQRMQEIGITISEFHVSIFEFDKNNFICTFRLHSVVLKQRWIKLNIIKLFFVPMKLGIEQLWMQILIEFHFGL